MASQAPPSTTVSVPKAFLDQLETLSSVLNTGLKSLKEGSKKGESKELDGPISVERKVSDGPSKGVTAEEVKQVRGDRSMLVMIIVWVLRVIKWTLYQLKEMAAEISHDYRGKEILAVGLLTGCIMFQMNLLKYLTVPYKIATALLLYPKKCENNSVSSYGSGTTSSGNVKMKKDLSKDPNNQHILITEDLIDTGRNRSGRTLKFISKYFTDKKCSSFKIACLLSKKARRVNDLKVDYCGFDCPDEFVVGYGMDFAGHYRCLPFVGVLKEEAFSGK
eukprot:jgi/Bigna1/136701/aug1.35_g11409